MVYPASLHLNEHVFRPADRIRNSDISEHVSRSVLEEGCCSHDGDVDGAREVGASMVQSPREEAMSESGVAPPSRLLVETQKARSSQSTLAPWLRTLRTDISAQPRATPEAASSAQGAVVANGSNGAAGEMEIMSARG